MKEKRALFGGTLRCAGLAAAAAMTSGAMADFNRIDGPGPAPNYTFNYGVGAGPDYTYHVFAYDLNYGAGFPADTFTSNADGSLGAFANATAMGAYASVAAVSQWQYAGAATQQYFTVDVDKGAIVTWDLLAGNAAAGVIVYEIGVGYLLDAGPGTSGSEFLNLVAGAEYIFFARASLTGGFGETAFVEMVWVPGPGALPLIGLGMLGVKRRRRRE